uniref:Uncharacterized protein n=1 Tax=Anopheles culicifacies TaxID=139723 RepID=A0A182MSM1_9DIPT
MGELMPYSPINPTGNMETFFVYRISLNSFRSNVLSSSPKYRTPVFIPFCRIQCSAARRLATPRGAFFRPRYISGIGLASWVYGMPRSAATTRVVGHDPMQPRHVHQRLTQPSYFRDLLTPRVGWRNKIYHRFGTFEQQLLLLDVLPLLLVVTLCSAGFVRRRLRQRAGSVQWPPLI